MHLHYHFSPRIQEWFHLDEEEKGVVLMLMESCHVRAMQLSVQYLLHSLHCSMY